MASTQLESGADIDTPMTLFPESYNAVSGLGDKGIVNFWHAMGQFYYGEDYEPPAGMRARSIFDEWKRKQIAQAANHRQRKGAIKKRWGRDTAEHTATDTAEHTATDTAEHTATDTAATSTVLPVTVLPNNRKSPVTVSRAHAGTERNGDLEMGDGIEKRTADFKRAFAKDSDAIFDYGFDTVAICRAITGDTHSDPRWAQLTRKKGEEAVREAVRDKWAEWREYGEAENKGAALQSRLDELPDATMPESEVA